MSTFGYMNNLKAAWRFDEINPRDVSGNGFTATGVGIESGNLVRGPRGNDWGVSLNGTDERFDVSGSLTVRTVAVYGVIDTLTEQVFKLATGKYATISSGSLALTGITATAFYVNGVTSGTFKIAQPFILILVLDADTTADSLSFGFDGTNYGSIDLFASGAYNKALTQAQAVHLTDRIRQGQFI